MYIIYKTTCVVNGKIYIGQHKNNGVRNKTIRKGEEKYLMVGL